jgi:PEP-CTERM motif
MPRNEILRAAMVAAIACGAAAAPSLAEAQARRASCSWDSPGQDKYTGGPAQALEAYRGLFTESQFAELQAMMATRRFTEQVVITRDTIVGSSGLYSYAPEIRDMHFGAGAVCTNTTRTGWAAGATMRAIVLAPSGANDALLLPEGCGNWARVQIRRASVPAGPSPLDGWTTGAGRSAAPAPSVGPTPEEPRQDRPAMTDREKFDAQRKARSTPQLWTGQGTGTPRAAPQIEPDAGGQLVLTVPEPSSGWMVGMALAAGLVATRRKKGAKK